MSIPLQGIEKDNFMEVCKEVVFQHGVLEELGISELLSYGIHMKDELGSEEAEESYYNITYDIDDLIDFAERTKSSTFKYIEFDNGEHGEIDDLIDVIMCVPADGIWLEEKFKGAEPVKFVFDNCEVDYNPGEIEDFFGSEKIVSDLNFSKKDAHLLLSVYGY